MLKEYKSYLTKIDKNYVGDNRVTDSKGLFYKDGISQLNEVPTKEIIFNEHLIDWNSPIVLVEGVFDAVKAGKNAVPVLGSWVDTKYEVFKKIIEKKCDVILALDPDAKGKQIKISENLISYGIDVKNTQNLEKDLGDMTKKEAQNLILNAKPFDNMERMRYLISGIKSGSIF